MSRHQLISLLAPILLIAVMFPIFQLLASKVGRTLAWYAGLASYWLLWGALFPLSMFGPGTIFDLIRPGEFRLDGLLLALIPAVLAGVGRFKFGIQYDKASTWIGVALLATAFGNGLFEEIFWRGTYLMVFPSSFWLGVLWPSLWFGLWHYAPGSVSSGGDVFRLMVGAGFLGAFLSFLARRTGTIFWSILAHTLAGLVMVL